MFWRRPTSSSSTAMPAAVFLLGVCIAAAVGLLLRHDIDAQATVRFQHSADRVVEEVGLRFHRPIYGLNAIRGLYAVNQRVHRGEFATYVLSHDPREFPGLRGFGFIQRVIRRDLDTFVAAERGDGAPQFAIRKLDDTNFDDLFVVKYIEPISNNGGVPGLDVGSELRRRQTMELAIDAGQPTITGAVRLKDGERGYQGMLLYVPIFSSGAGTSTVAERRASLVGLAYAPIIVSELLGGIRDVVAGGVRFELFDVPGSNPTDALIYDSAGFPAGAPGDVNSTDVRRFSTIQTLSLPNRDLTLRVTSTPEFDAEIPVAPPWLAFGGGALVSALLAMLVWLQATGRRRAESLARSMTVDLDRLAQVAKHTSNSVSIVDRDLRITWTNEGFTRLTGYTFEEARGNNPSELLSSDNSNAVARNELANAAATGRGYRIESLIRAKGGREYWVDTEIQPLLDAVGSPIGFMEIGNDVTARKNAGRELARERQRLDNIIEGTNVGTWEWNLDTGETVLNERWAQIVGHTLAELGPTTIETWIGRTHPDDVGAARSRLKQHLHGETSALECELRVRHKHGHWVWVLTRGKIVARGDDDGSRWMSGTHMDISDRKRVEQELQAQRDFATHIINTMGQGLAVADAEGNFEFVNPVYARLVGCASTDLIGKHISNVTVAEDCAFQAEKTAECRTGKTATYEVRFRRADGGVVPVSITAAPRRRDGQFIGSISVITDLTERKQAEAEVQRSAQLLRGAIDAIDEAFVLFDADDRLIFCNDKYRNYYSDSNDLIVPGVAFEAIVRHGAERGQFPAAVGRVDQWVAERLAIHCQPSGPLTERLADGRIMRIAERKTPDGHAVGFRVDITELVRATEAAQEAKADAEAATAAKSQFLANMSHEIRTPMSAILGMFALLRKTELTARQADYAGKAEGAARSLLGLLNDILDFSKVEAGKMTLDPQPFRVDQMLRDLSVILSANVGPKPVEVLFDIDPRLPRKLTGDAMRLQQVLINLCGNAIKFTAEGEVVLSMAMVRQDASTVTMEISVRDTGIGIAPENQARIFAGFTQAEASTTRRFGGSGLGLAISQRLVAVMGGELRLDSTLGEGSRFHFCITLALTASPPASEPPWHAPMRTLVVDDNPTACDVLERMGQSLGWTVDVVDSGERALELLQARTAAGIEYHAVFVDWQMPGLDGWETSRRIRELGSGGTAPIVVMITAHGLDMLSRRSEADQVLLDGFLVKPITASMLFDAVVDARSERAHPHPSRPGVLTGGQRLVGMRLLVAEDNLNNQQVARELLEGEGAIVQIANDGHEAVVAVTVAEAPFDVVLMDLQMPIMDGFTAARRIRQNFAPETLPIVAMTANVMAADREACLAAGMNDHVGKPFDLNHLVEVLRKYSRRQHSGKESVVNAKLALPNEVRAAAAAAGVDIVAALNRLGNNTDLYQRMLGLFVKDLSEMPAQLADYVARGESEAALRLLHTLKGEAATLGATALSADAGRGETQLSEDPAPAAAAATTQAACAAMVAAGLGLASLLQAMQVAEAPSEATGAPFNAASFLTALRVMSEQLRSADMAATDSMTDLQRQFGGTSGAQLRSLKDAVDTLDFERATQLCDDLIGELNDGQPGDTRCRSSNPA
jgi:PAS domain S-box-containing protein